MFHMSKAMKKYANEFIADDTIRVMGCAFALFILKVG